MTGTYKSGEQPQVGDRVRWVSSRSHVALKLGDVVTIARIGGSPTAEVWVDYPQYGSRWSFAEQFALIARAGEVVKFQVGDVVEFTHTIAVNTTKKVGERDIVIKIDGSGEPVLQCDRDKDYGWGKFAPFRLVHRPDAVSKPQPDSPHYAETPRWGLQPNAIAGTLIKESDLRQGDRARFTVEGVWNDIPNSKLDGVYFSQDEFDSATIELLERTTFAVGDDVTILDGGKAKIIAFTTDGRAVLEYEAGDTTNVCARDTSCLTAVAA